MIIVDFGRFNIDESRRGDGILYFVNEEGQDWYELQGGLLELNEIGDFVSAVFGAWALVDPEGILTNVESDPSRMVPHDKVILGIDADLSDIKPGMRYVDGVLKSAEDI